MHPLARQYAGHWPDGSARRTGCVIKLHRPIMSRHCRDAFRVRETIDPTDIPVERLGGCCGLCRLAQRLGPSAAPRHCCAPMYIDTTTREACREESELSCSSPSPGPKHYGSTYWCFEFESHLTHWCISSLFNSRFCRVYLTIFTRYPGRNYYERGPSSKLSPPRLPTHIFHHSTFYLELTGLARSYCFPFRAGHRRGCPAALPCCRAARTRRSWRRPGKSQATSSSGTTPLSSTIPRYKGGREHIGRELELCCCPSTEASQCCAMRKQPNCLACTASLRTCDARPQQVHDEGVCLASC